MLCAAHVGLPVVGAHNFVRITLSERLPEPISRHFCVGTSTFPNAQRVASDCGGSHELPVQRPSPAVDRRSGVHRPAAGHFRHAAAIARCTAGDGPLPRRVDRHLARRQAHPRGRAHQARRACGRGFRARRLGVLRRESRMVAGQSDDRRRRADHDGIPHPPLRFRWPEPSVPHR